MKSFLIIFIYLIFATNVHAQSFKNTGSGLNRVELDPEDEEDAVKTPGELAKSQGNFLEELQLLKSEQKLNFQQLPKDIELMMTATDAEGNIILQRKLNSKTSTINTQKWIKGFYFITVFKEEQPDMRKSFSIDLQ